MKSDMQATLSGGKESFEKKFDMKSTISGIEECRDKVSTCKWFKRKKSRVGIGSDCKEGNMNKEYHEIENR